MRITRAGTIRKRRKSEATAITLNYRRKDRKKAIRSVLQFVLLLLIAAWIVQALFDLETYREPDKSQWTNRDGFAAVSYFGVGRRGNTELIPKRKLDEQLEALHDRGYETITQEDILAFYEEGKPLPERALYLSFEDGRNDSALFTQPMLEDYNFKATALTYANKAGSKEGKFLQPKELLKMEKSGFWELGSNGYRLTFINIVDRNGDYIPELDRNVFLDLWEAQYYTHYLMDFIRDADGVPLEDREAMQERILGDYRLMESVYKDKFGYVPATYMIMHANTLYNGMNALVESVNDAEIRRLFQLHFNREGQAYNTPENDRFDLTRVQPASYWETNHLLMQLRHDTGETLPFKVGDEAAASAWEIKDGAAEFWRDRIALTSPPGGNGLMVLKGSEAWNDIDVSLSVKGHYSGYQSIYLRHASDSDYGLRVLVREGELVIDQKAPGAEKERLLLVKLDDRLRDKAKKLRILLQGGELSVFLNGNALLEREPVHKDILGGALALSAMADPKEVRWNEYDVRDTIYDAVFQEIRIRDAVGLADSELSQEMLFSNILSPLRRVGAMVEETFHAIVDWAIEML